MIWTVKIVSGLLNCFIFFFRHQQIDGFMVSMEGDFMDESELPVFRGQTSPTKSKPDLTQLLTSQRHIPSTSLKGTIITSWTVETQRLEVKAIISTKI